MAGAVDDQDPFARRQEPNRQRPVERGHRLCFDVNGESEEPGAFGCFRFGEILAPSMIPGSWPRGAHCLSKGTLFTLRGHKPLLTLATNSLSKRIANRPDFPKLADAEQTGEKPNA